MLLARRGYPALIATLPNPSARLGGRAARRGRRDESARSPQAKGVRQETSDGRPCDASDPEGSPEQSHRAAEQFGSRDSKQVAVQGSEQHCRADTGSKSGRNRQVERWGYRVAQRRNADNDHPKGDRAQVAQAFDQLPAGQVGDQPGNRET